MVGCKRGPVRDYPCCSAQPLLLFFCLPKRKVTKEKGSPKKRAAHRAIRAAVFGRAMLLPCFIIGKDASCDANAGR